MEKFCETGLLVRIEHPGSVLLIQEVLYRCIVPALLDIVNMNMDRPLIYISSC